MADLTVTAADFRPFADATFKTVTAATTVTVGQLVYKDTTDANKYRPTDATAAASALLAGIAVTNSSDSSALVIQTGGSVDPGATTAAGTIYTCSTNAGGIAPSADNTSGNFNSIFGVGKGTGEIRISIDNTSTAHA